MQNLDWAYAAAHIWVEATAQRWAEGVAAAWHASGRVGCRTCVTQQLNWLWFRGVGVYFRRSLVPLSTTSARACATLLSAWPLHAVTALAIPRLQGPDQRGGLSGNMVVALHNAATCGQQQQLETDGALASMQAFHNRSCACNAQQNNSNNSMCRMHVLKGRYCHLTQTRRTVWSLKKLCLHAHVRTCAVYC